jgi:hypothetical protein
MRRNMSRTNRNSELIRIALIYIFVLVLLAAIWYLLGL